MLCAVQYTIWCGWFVGNEGKEKKKGEYSIHVYRPVMVPASRGKTYRKPSTKREYSAASKVRPNSYL